MQNLTGGNTMGKKKNERKKPYSKPRIVYEGQLEVRCGTPPSKDRPLDWPKEVPFPE
jgi:hypothetical protein